LVEQLAQLPAATFAELQHLNADHVVRTYPPHDAMCAEAEAVHLEAEIESIADAAYEMLTWPDEAALEAQIDHLACDAPVVDAEVDGAVAGATWRFAGFDSAGHQSFYRQSCVEL
jgi:hypothetical protein